MLVDYWQIYIKERNPTCEAMWRNNQTGMQQYNNDYEQLTSYAFLPRSRAAFNQITAENIMFIRSVPKHFGNDWHFIWPMSDHCNENESWKLNFPIDIFLKRKMHSNLSTHTHTILTTFDFIGVTLVAKEAQYFINTLVATMYQRLQDATDCWQLIKLMLVKSCQSSAYTNFLIE